MSNSYIKKLCWKDARHEVEKVNPSLTEAIDELDPPNRLKLIKIRYPFGQKVLENGVLFVPIANNKFVSINDPRVDSDIRENLLYNKTMPPGVVLKNSLELFIWNDSQPLPFSLMSEGKIFSLWTVLDGYKSVHSGNVWNITSGARSIMMLPRISHATHFKRIQREFSISKSAPKKLINQWDTFVELSNHKDLTTNWYSEVILFTNDWWENKTDKNWRLFRYYFLDNVWQNTTYLTNQVIFDVILSRVLIEKNLKPNPYITDTVRHLYHLGLSEYPGFVVAHDNSAAPVDMIQKVFIDTYDLKYVPSVLHPGYIDSITKNTMIYYSLSWPTIMSFSPKSKKFSTKLDDIFELKHVVDRVSQYIVDNSFGLEETPIHNWANGVEHYYYHTDANAKSDTLPIKITTELIRDDNNIKSDINKYSNLEYCNSSIFFRGCVGIRKKHY